MSSVPADKITTLRPRKPCPICGKPSAQAWHPFCSTRCADIDLNRWLTGAYAIPVAEEEVESVPGEAAEEAEN
ncbi:MAG: DNA gyrase inhibitor YacG [Cucumibacter sp.]